MSHFYHKCQVAHNEFRLRSMFDDLFLCGSLCPLIDVYQYHQQWLKIPCMRTLKDD